MGQKSSDFFNEHIICTDDGCIHTWQTTSLWKSWFEFHDDETFIWVNFSLSLAWVCFSKLAFLAIFRRCFSMRSLPDKINNLLEAQSQEIIAYHRICVLHLTWCVAAQSWVCRISFACTFCSCTREWHTLWIDTFERKMCTSVLQQSVFLYIHHSWQPV